MSPFFVRSYGEQRRYAVYHQKMQLCYAQWTKAKSLHKSVVTSFPAYTGEYQGQGVAIANRDIELSVVDRTRSGLAA